MGTEVRRTGYLETLNSYRAYDAIKVIKGMRRTGKSTILRQFIGELKSDGVQEEDIVYVDMESLTNTRYKDGMVLYNEIVLRWNERKNKLYILLDEIQFIDGWERVVNSLKVDIDCDIYVTGSNAYLFSSDISTLLTGRSVSITVLPLALGEYCELGMGVGPKDAFITYVRLGGLPVMRPDQTEEMLIGRINEIKSDIILKDICNRKERVDSHKIRRTIDYLFSEIGNTISTEKVSKSLDISTSTAAEYIDMITDSMIFIKAERYDLKGKMILKSQPKYYCTDLGMRAGQPISVDDDYGRKLENIVYLELVRRGKRVYVGKIGGLEVDFVTIGENGTDYYQVAMSIRDPETREREMRPLRHISDRGEKYVITNDDVPRTETSEAVIINIVDFLMQYSNGKEKTVRERLHFNQYLEVSRRLDSYADVCSELMNRVITPYDFTDVSYRLQNSFFNLQSSFKAPAVVNDDYMQGLLKRIIDIEVGFFDTFMACANANRGKSRFLLVDDGGMAELSRIREEVSVHVKSIKGDETLST